MLLIVGGIVGSSAYGQKQDFELSPGQSATFAGQRITYNGLKEVRHANFTAVAAEVVFTAADGKATTLYPQRRFYDKSEQPNSEVALQSDWKRDVYMTLAGWDKGGAKTAIQVLVNPLVSWIWAGGVVMSIGAILALLPRLLPAPAVAKSAEAAPASPGRKRLAVRPAAST
jgi:cytochrome c-type biogenesis protein CcmF